MNHRRIAAVGAGLAAAAVAALAVAPGATAAVPKFTITTDAVQAAGGWLTTQFVGAKHVPTPTGDHFESTYQKAFYPNQGENADVIFGLAAAQVGAAKITTAITYLEQNANTYGDISNADGYGPNDGGIAKMAVAAQVAGVDPTAFGNYDLLATLKKDECPATSTTCTPGSAANIFSSVSESLVLLAEARAGGTAAPSTAAIDYFLTLQCPDGGFTSKPTACAAADEDVDSTSYAVMALQAVGGHQAQLAKAASWLAGRQNSAGYWTTQGGPNVNSTGLAAAALAGTGADIAKAQSWLRGQQVPAGKPGAGALKYQGTFTPGSSSIGASPSVLATAQGLTGLVPDGSLATLTAKGAADAPAVFAPTARLGTTKLAQGAKVTVTGTGFAAGERVQVVLHSTPVTVGSVTADASGSAKVAVTVPKTLAIGAHTAEVVGQASGLSASESITVTAAPVDAPSTGGTPSTSPAPGTVLANTGRDDRQLIRLTVVGLLAVLAGAGLLVLARRRYVGAHAKR